MAEKKATKANPSSLTKLRDVQLKTPVVEFRDASGFKAEYDATDSAVKQAVESSLDKQVELIAALARMRSLLSQRSTEKVRKEAGVTRGWVQYFQWFQRTYKFQMCLRTVLNKIDRLNGKKFCPSCNKVNGHTPSCPKYKKPEPQLSYRESRIVGGLSAAHDLVKEIERGGDIQEAAREYKRSAPKEHEVEEWKEKQAIPYEPATDDLLVVNDQQFKILQVRGISQKGGEYVLTFAVQPLCRPFFSIPSVTAPDTSSATNDPRKNIATPARADEPKPKYKTATA